MGMKRGRAIWPALALLLLGMGCGGDDGTGPNGVNGNREDPPAFARTWGTQGLGNGQFWQLEGIAVDAQNNVFTADLVAERVQKFTSGGVFVTSWGTQPTSGCDDTAPSDIAVGPNGSVYVTEYHGGFGCLAGSSVQIFTNAGAFVRKWDDEGLGVAGLAVDPSGNVYILRAAQVRKLDSSGSLVTSWGSAGDGPGQFSGPEDVAVDSNGYVYVADTGNARIQKFDSSGGYVTEWAFQKGAPMAVGVGPDGSVYVAGRVNTGDYPIQKFNADGKLLSRWGLEIAAEPSYVGIAQGITVDGQGNIYVADTSFDRVVVFSYE